MVILMSYKKKVFGEDFIIRDKYEEWFYGLWKKTNPASFVLLRLINKEDFVFMDVGRDSNNPNNILKPTWYRFLVGIDNEPTEIDSDEAEVLLGTLENERCLKEADLFYKTTSFEETNDPIVGMTNKEGEKVISLNHYSSANKHIAVIGNSLGNNEDFIVTNLLQIAKRGENAFVIDPKGNLCKNEKLQDYFLNKGYSCCRFDNSFLEKFGFDAIAPEVNKNYGPTLYFYCVPEHMEQMTSAFLSHYLTAVVKEIDSIELRNCLPVNMIFNETANLGEINDFHKKLATFSSKLINVMMFFDSISQVQHAYPNSWQTIFGNCDTVILDANATLESENAHTLLGKQKPDFSGITKDEALILGAGEPLRVSKLNRTKHPEFKKINAD